MKKWKREGTKRSKMENVRRKRKKEREEEGCRSKKRTKKRRRMKIITVDVGGIHVRDILKILKN